MSYTPTEWESTDVVTATRLNALEQAVGDLNMSYTPNVWQNGDILTADKMNALEQAVASGGGGGSDLTEAEVVFTNNTAGYMPCWGFVVDANIPATLFLSGLFQSETLTVPLYQGLAIWELDPEYQYNNVTTTGDVVIDTDEGIMLISGDCTITLT